MFANRLTLAALVALPLFALAGCSDGDASHPEADAGGAGGAASAGGAAGDALGGIARSALASPCTVGSQCTSGYCVDGVCCDSPCGEQCLSCSLVGATGHCGPIANGPDAVSASPCIGGSSCFLDPATSLSTCKLTDGAGCSADSDCGSGHCFTYYVDADGDGYGTTTSAKFCNELNGAPPVGYAAYGGDCCDLDSGANPGFSSGTYLQFPDACGSYDWNCNGSIALQYSSCPYSSSGLPSCGTDCVAHVGIITETLYSQACN
jgi:hypothetical protein